MTKPFSEEDLSRQLIEDRTWRLREIGDLRTAVGRADVTQRNVLMRALVAVCYAHWEGYVRHAARKYLEHIAIRKLNYADLDRQFIKNYFLPRLGALSKSNASVKQRCELLDDILNADGKRFSRVNEDLINTQSNLNFDVFSDICLICGINGNDYAKHQTFIDVFLLKRRNSIAHGEDTFVSIADMPVLAETTIELMRCFGDDLENKIVLKLYKTAPTSAASTA